MTAARCFMVAMTACLGACAAAKPTVTVTQLETPDTYLHVVSATLPKPRGTVIVIHGGPGISHEYTRPFIAALGRARYRVILYDQRGVGRSSPPLDEHYGLSPRPLWAHAVGRMSETLLAAPDRVSPRSERFDETIPACQLIIRRR